MGYLLGIDVGTSSSKALIMDYNGTILAFESSSYEFSIPNIGYAEQNANTLWDNVVIAVKKALNKSKIREINAIGVTGQMHGLVTLDGDNNPIRPVIIWADQRSSAEVEVLKNENEFGRCANSAATGFALTSLMWLKKNEKESFAKVRKIMMPKDFILLQLTGTIGTDLSDASGSLMLDAETCEWDTRLLKCLDFDSSILPQIHESCEIVGFVRPQIAVMLGLREEIPVIAGGGDSLMQLVGNGVVSDGQINTNIGTASQISCVTNLQPKKGNVLNNFHHVAKDLWVRCGASLNGGLVLNWAKNLFFRGNIQYDELDKMAEKAPPGSGGIIFLPFICGERAPYFDDKAKGILYGLSISNSPEELIRAFLESVVYSFKDSMRFFDPGIVKGNSYIIASGGGAKSRLWLQLQADILGKPVRINTTSVEAAKGAAICAGVGIRVYESITDACRKVVKLSDRVFEPNEKNMEVYDARFETYLKLYQNNKELFLLN